MPPRTQVSKDAIIASAFTMTRANGFDRITARSLAASLHCSTQPIFYAFSDMKALEAATAQYAYVFMLSKLSDNSETMTNTTTEDPEALAFIMRYIRFALDERYLFSLIAKNGLFAAPPEGMPNTPQALDFKLILFANGIIFMHMFGTLNFDWQQTQNIVREAYADFSAKNTATCL